MKVAFIHDFHVINYKNDYFSTNFNYKMWQRYLGVYNELVIVSRVKQVKKKPEKMPLSSGENIYFNNINEYSSIKNFFKYYKKIEKKIEKTIEESDGVIIRLPSILGFMAAKICQKKNKSYCVEVVGASFEAFWYRGLYSKIVAIPAEIMQKKAIKNADVAIYITEKYLQKKYPNNNKSFYGVSNVTIDDLKDYKNELEERGSIRIGLVGSTFVKYKGHLCALRMLIELLEKGYKVKLSFVGQGPSENIKRQVKKLNLQNYVEFKGTIKNREEMNKWYRSLDIYIQPSITEGQGRSIVEAVSNGIPTYASNVGGISDSVDNAYLFDKNDNYQLAQLIIKNIENPKIARENVKKNQEKISKYNKANIESKRNKALKKYRQIIKDDNR
ncbi:glycosyltransferase [Nosocomiicoccus sp. HMSC09A07]|uniref:glycosyltransferase n=1 Tax=Nosocomiicoccus sp. HMSC09A07 TaxID=1581145 RepID=UPI0008A499A3|nr:glycosyltransferase [Nosocomiicoccus sp. HMSC09A07]OFS62177.1 hypothetical protein HMPREF3177_06680 [Nosocomiicoccus sp. HMSC09A07]